MRSQLLNRSLRAIKSLHLLGRPRNPTQPRASLDRLDETITFKCTGEASEEAKHATSDEHTAVLLADFYRAGDGDDESFTAQMIVSPNDIAPGIEGVQNVWVQGVGCGSAIVHFSSTH